MFQFELPSVLFTFNADKPAFEALFELPPTERNNGRATV